MKKYLLSFGLIIAPLCAMDGGDSHSEGLRIEEQEIDDIAALEAGAPVADRHNELAVRARDHGHKRTARKKRQPGLIEDELFALESGTAQKENTRLAYAMAICDREGVKGVGRKRILDLVEGMSNERFAEFHQKMGEPTRTISDDKKFNLLLEMLVKAQEDASAEVRKQLEVAQESLEEQKRQFEIEQKRADSNRRRAIIAGTIGGIGTVVATIIAIAKYAEEANA